MSNVTLGVKNYAQLLNMKIDKLKPLCEITKKMLKLSKPFHAMARAFHC